MACIYDYEITKRDKEKISMNEYKGKVLIIVNTATGCGFTPQYAGLEELYRKYHDKGLEILDFPCNQFGHQAPGDDNEIHEFCTAKYNTTFDQLKKIEVNGENTEPLWSYLKSLDLTEDVKGVKDKLAMAAVEKIARKTGNEKGLIRWNFTKFLVDRGGNVVERFAPTTKPDMMEMKIKELI